MRTCSFLATCTLFTVLSATALAAPPEEVAFSGSAESPISAAVAIPTGRALYLTSGTVPPVAD